MKKSIKVILILFFIILFLVGLFFVVKNKMLNNSVDLVCVRSYPESQDKEKITIKFDKDGIAKEYIETQILYFSTSEEAKYIYEQGINNSTNNTDTTIDLFYDSKMELENNIVKSSFYFKVKKGQEMYNKTRKELMSYYETNYMYECESL